MRNAPTYATPVEHDVVGDDPLGLSAFNERLYNLAFPGFNNVVRHIRVYSSICWMALQVENAFDAGAVATDVEGGEFFKRAVSKIELALLWANPKVRGIPGNRRKFPDDDLPVRFSFESFGSSKASLLDPVNYGPSLTGLRFVEALDGHTFSCLPAGVELANAFDWMARDLPSYEWLKSPQLLEGSASDVLHMVPALDVRCPTPLEQDAFLATFFPETLPAESTPDEEFRWQTLHLMLRAVNAASDARLAARGEAGASSQAVRACMARGYASDGTSLHTEDVAVVQALWAVLQVRQLQRLCLDALYCVLERWIAERETDGRSRTLEACRHDLPASGLEALDESFRDTVGQLLEFFEQRQNGRRCLYEAAALDPLDEDDDADVFMHIDRVESKDFLEFDAHGNSMAVGHAYIGLVFCAVEALNLSADPHALKALEADEDDCSLLRLAAFVSRNKDSTVEHFLGQLVKDWVVLRHFSIVTNRALAANEDRRGKNRFRFVMGDYGLERVSKTARLPTPGISRDRLDHALLLCEQAGLLTVDRRHYELTAAGHERLQL